MKHQHQSSKLLFYANGKDAFLLIVSLVSSTLHGACIILVIYLFGNLINACGNSIRSPSQAFEEVAQVVHRVLYVALATLFSAAAEVISSSLLGERLASRLLLSYFQALLDQDVPFHDLHIKAGDVVSSISSDIILIQNAIGEKLSVCIHNFSIFLSGAIISVFVCWSLGLLGLAVSPLLICVGAAYMAAYSKYSAMASTAYNDANQVSEQTFSQMRSVYSYVAEVAMLSRISSHLDKATALARATGLSKGLGLGFALSIAYGAWAGQFAYASGLVRQGILRGGTVFAMASISLFCGKALTECLQALELVIKGCRASTKFLDVIERKPVIVSNSVGHVPPRILGHIEFCSVSFAYPSRPDVPIFSEFSLEIPQSKIVAVVGTSGSGKSSLISLIERFYDPDKGQVLIDGTDIRELQFKWLRNQIGLVSQEPILFAMSIRQNIQLGKPQATDEEIQSAAKVANAHSFISELPEGYDTQVGHLGTKLSGGQKQRLAIARAVLSDPAIMLLDEATSALDSESEILVQDALDNTVQGRTTIVIAHRLSTIIHADQIVVLREGRVVESCSSPTSRMQNKVLRPDVCCDYCNLCLSRKSVAPGNLKKQKLYHHLRRLLYRLIKLSRSTRKE